MVVDPANLCPVPLSACFRLQLGLQPPGCAGRSLFVFPRSGSAAAIKQDLPRSDFPQDSSLMTPSPAMTPPTAAVAQPAAKIAENACIHPAQPAPRLSRLHAPSLVTLPSGTATFRDLASLL